MKENKTIAAKYIASDETVWFIGTALDRECEIARIEADIAYEYLREESREEWWQM